MCLYIDALFTHALYFRNKIFLKLISSSKFLDIANWTNSANLVKSVKHFNEVSSACLSICES